MAENTDIEVIPKRSEQEPGIERVPKRPPRIKTWVFCAMLIVAIILDLVSLIPAANDITLVIAGILFGLWWWKLGLGFLNLKKIITYSLSVIVEAVPILAVLPAVTLAVVVTFVISRGEDKLGISIMPGKFGIDAGKNPKRIGLKERFNSLKKETKWTEDEKKIFKRKDDTARKDKNPLAFVPGEYSKETGSLEDTDKEYDIDE